MKLFKLQHRTWKRNQFFSSWVVISWNKLPDKVVNSRTVITLKHNYDQTQNDHEAAPMGFSSLAHYPILLVSIYW